MWGWRKVDVSEREYESEKILNRTMAFIEICHPIFVRRSVYSSNFCISYNIINSSFIHKYLCANVLRRFNFLFQFGKPNVWVIVCSYCFRWFMSPFAAPGNCSNKIRQADQCYHNINRDHGCLERHITFSDRILASSEFDLENRISFIGYKCCYIADRQ